MLGELHPSLPKSLKSDGSIPLESPLPTLLEDPLLCCVVPGGAARIQPAFDAEWFSRKVKHIQPDESIRRWREVCVVEDARVAAEYPFIAGLVKRLRRLLSFANQITEVVLSPICEWQDVVLIHEHKNRQKYGGKQGWRSESKDRLARGLQRDDLAGLMEDPEGNHYRNQRSHGCYRVDDPW